MTSNLKKCYTCLNIRAEESGYYFTSIIDLDEDQVPYLEKLRLCINTNLFEVNNMEICAVCINDLRICYKFRNLVLFSQDTLRLQPKLEMDETKLEKFDNESITKMEEESNNNSCASEEEIYEMKQDDNSGESDNESKSKNRRNYSRVSSNLYCSMCGSEFNKEWKLRKHFTRVHDPLRKYTCTYCGKQFKQSFHLKEHLTSHTGEKNYSCTICGKKFQRQSSQRRHEKSHDKAPGEKCKRTPFLCTICGKSFPFSNSVQRHMRIHLGIRNFECNICKRKFGQSTHLNVHMRRHTGEKPFICDTCGENFMLKSMLLKHIRNLHQ